MINDNEKETWPETWMNVARQIAKHSYDDKLKVAAIIVTVDNTRILSLGYNGNAHGLPNKRDSMAPGMSGFIHAEQNAFYKLNYTDPVEKIMYVLYSPCVNCAKGAIQCKINRVVYDKVFREPAGIDVLRQGGIEIYSLEEAKYLDKMNSWNLKGEFGRHQRQLAIENIKYKKI